MISRQENLSTSEKSKLREEMDGNEMKEDRRWRSCSLSARSGLDTDLRADFLSCCHDVVHVVLMKVRTTRTITLFYWDTKCEGDAAFRERA
jgi:hypothetical protein